MFILSLHLLPVDGDLWGTERWAAKEDDLSVYYALTVVETSMKTRLEKLRISMLVKNKKESFRLSDHITLRIYTAPQLKSLIAKSKKLKLIAVHDFWYDIESTQKLNGEAVRFDFDFATSLVESVGTNPISCRAVTWLARQEPRPPGGFHWTWQCKDV